MKVLATVLILSGLALAADAPKLNEVDTLKVQNAYLVALTSQHAVGVAQDQFQKDVASFRQVIADVKKAEGIPTEDDIVVGPDNKTITVSVPPAKSEAPSPKK